MSPVPDEDLERNAAADQRTHSGQQQQQQPQTQQQQQQQRQGVSGDGDDKISNDVEEEALSEEEKKMADETITGHDHDHDKRATTTARRNTQYSVEEPPHDSSSLSISSASTSSTSSDNDDLAGLEQEKSADLDGHRPTLREIRSNTRSRSRLRRGSNASGVVGEAAASAGSIGGGAGAGTGGGVRAASIRSSGTDALGTARRSDTMLSRIRSRPVVQFSHPLSHVPTTEDQLVDFEGPDDPYHPLNWGTKKKVITTVLYGFVTMSSTWASSAYSAGTLQVAEEFHVSEQTATLGTSLFLVGFGLGPLLWAPLSEVFGRRAAVLSPMFVAMCFSFGSATAKDLQTLMLTRFFCAFFGAAPVTNTGGVLGDLYSPAWRGIAMAGYAMSVVGGPVIGPIVSAALVQQPSLGWRWTEYLTGILQALMLTTAAIFTDESYPPRLLVFKARRLRHDTGNWALHAKFEEWDVSIQDLARKFLVRPVQLLCTPICFLVALYASFCYGILYMQLGAIPFIFGRIRGWGPFVAELPFLCIFIGAVLGCSANVYNQLLYNKAYHAAGDRAVPEKRLPPMMLGSLLFCSGQFVLGWTAQPSIHWLAPCFGLIMMGTGFFTIFQAALNYLVDTFQLYAASAIAANTFLRSSFAAAFPLVVTPMYTNIGVGPGSSITGGFAALLIPVPFVFYIYGKRIRASSKWSKSSVYD